MPETPHTARRRGRAERRTWCGRPSRRPPRVQERLGAAPWEPAGVNCEAVRAGSRLGPGPAAGAGRRARVIVCGLPSANYTRGAVCAGPEPSSKVPPSSHPSGPAFERSPFLVAGSSRTPKVLGAPQERRSRVRYSLAGGSRPGFACETCQDRCCQGAAPTSSVCTGSRGMEGRGRGARWPWQEGWHTRHLTQEPAADRGQKQWAGAHTLQAACSPKILELLGEGGRSSPRREESTPRNMGASLVFWVSFVD